MNSIIGDNSIWMETYYLSIKDWIMCEKWLSPKLIQQDLIWWHLTHHSWILCTFKSVSCLVLYNLTMFDTCMCLDATFVESCRYQAWWCRPLLAKYFCSNAIYDGTIWNRLWFNLHDEILFENRRIYMIMFVTFCKYWFYVHLIVHIILAFMICILHTCTHVSINCDACKL